MSTRPQFKHPHEFAYPHPISKAHLALRRRVSPFELNFLRVPDLWDLGALQTFVAEEPKLRAQLKAAYDQAGETPPPFVDTEHWVVDKVREEVARR